MIPLNFVILSEDFASPQRSKTAVEGSLSLRFLSRPYKDFAPPL
jgi:hypothetical protein